MTYRLTDRFENWFITSLQTDVNDTTTSFRLNKALNVHQARLVIDPYNEDQREIVKVTSVDGTLVYVERGDDNTTPQYHLEGTIVALHVFAADMNDLYADWAEVEADMQQALLDAADATNAANIAANSATSAAGLANNAASSANDAASDANLAAGAATSAASSANTAAGLANSATSAANIAAGNAQDAADNAQGIVDDVAGAVADNIQPIEVDAPNSRVGIGKAPTQGALDVDGDIYAGGKKVEVVEDTGWKPLSLASGYTTHAADGTPMYRIKNGILYFKGSIAPSSGNMPTSGQVQITNSNPDLAQFYDSPYSGVMLAGPTGGTLARMYIGSGGTLTFGASGNYGNGNMSYISLRGLSGVYIL